MTIMLRMFLLGTIVPIIGLDGTARDVVQPLVSIIDIVGIYYALVRTVGRPEIKVCGLLNLFVNKLYKDLISPCWLGTDRRSSFDPFGLLVWR